MKNTMVKVGTVVPKMRPADISGNTKEIISVIEKNKDCGLLVFPELCLTGYTCGDLFLQQALLDAAEHALVTIAAATKELQLTAVIGLPVCYENRMYDCAAFVSRGCVAGIVPRSYLNGFGSVPEDRWFTPGDHIIGCSLSVGDENVPFGIDILADDTGTGALVGAEIGDDLFAPDQPSTHACLAGANIIAGLSACEEGVEKPATRREAIVGQSRRCACAYLFVSSGSGESSTDLVFSGHTIIAEGGLRYAESMYPQQTHVETAVIDLERISGTRHRRSSFTNTDNGWYRHVQVDIQFLGREEDVTVSALKRLLDREGVQVPRLPFVPEKDRLAERMQEVLAMQSHALATRLRAISCQTVIVGVSGGLDSTWTLIVCKETAKLIDGLRIIGYTMPSKGQTSGRTFDNSLALMDALGIEAREVPIKDTVEKHLEDIGHGRQYKGEHDIAYENAQARMRTMILLDAANMENALDIGTGDLSEIAMGWCTYNGDHMSNYAVNGSLPKTLMRAMTALYADVCGNEKLTAVLRSVLATPISPELRPNARGKIAQKTEDQIGSYDLNDFFLFYSVRFGFRPDKVIALAMTAYPELKKADVKQAMYRFCSRLFSQQFKRSCMVDGPKIGTIDLSPRGGFVMPSDASASLWLEIIDHA